MARAIMKGVVDDEIETAIAASAILPNRFCLKTTTGGTHKQCDAAGARTDGVSRLGAASGAAFALYRGGRQVVASGAAVAEGDLVMSDNVGRAVLQTSTNFIAGRALHAVTGADLLLEVQLTEAV